MPSIDRVLILDDDPSHLEIYSMIVERAGFQPAPVLVRFSGPDSLPDGDLKLVLLDYRLNSVRTAPDLAQEIRAKYGTVPIILLSDLWNPPPDIAPYISQFVRKGDPAKLVTALKSSINGGAAD